MFIFPNICFVHKYGNKIKDNRNINTKKKQIYSLTAIKDL